MRTTAATRPAFRLGHVLLGAAILVVAGLAFVPQVSAQATPTNVQEGNNRGTTHQKGSATSGSSNTGQIVGVVSSGRVSVDATNHTSDSSAKSGDANGSNKASSFVGNDVEGLPSCAPPPVGGDLRVAQPSPSCSGAKGSDVLFDGAIVTAPIVQEGDNRQTIAQTAHATTGDALAGQVIGVVSAGDASIVAKNDAKSVDATSGDANAHNSIADAQASNLATFVPCPCPVPLDIVAQTINAVIVQEGDNSQRLTQAANASTGAALAGAQVIGAVTSAGGRASVDASNRGQDAFATSGDADADNRIGVAASGDAGIDIPDCCTGPTNGDIIAATINAVIVHDGNNRQTIAQSASASTGDALSGAEAIGVVSAGNSSIVAANTGKNTDATSGDAHATNSIADAQTSDLAVFAPPSCCGVPGDIVATTISGAIVQDGNNRQILGQSASASTGDSVSGGQVIGDVTTAGGNSSIDARNEGTDTSATSGDATSDNSISRAFVGLEADGIEIPGSFFPIGVTGLTGINIQEGNNTQTEHQSADASSGDAISGGQVIGVVSSGSASIVQANIGTNIDTTSGDARFDNSANFQTGLLVIETPAAVGGDLTSPGFVGRRLF